MNSAVVRSIEPADSGDSMTSSVDVQHDRPRRARGVGRDVGRGQPLEGSRRCRQSRTCCASSGIKSSRPMGSILSAREKLVCNLRCSIA